MRMPEEAPLIVFSLSFLFFSFSRVEPPLYQWGHVTVSCRYQVLVCPQALNGTDATVPCFGAPLMSLHAGDKRVVWPSFSHLQLGLGTFTLKGC